MGSFATQPTANLCIHPFGTIFHKPVCPPSMDKVFKWWTDKGPYRISHFFTHSGSFTLSHCSSVLEMHILERFSFYQIAKFLNSIWPPGEPPSITACRKWCSRGQDIRGGIFMVYESLLTPSKKQPYMLAWERNLSCDEDLES